MAKTQYITLINVTANIVDGSLVIGGTMLKDGLAGARLSKKFAAGRVVFSRDVATTSVATVTNTPAAEIAAMFADIQSGNRAELSLTFRNDALSHVAVRHTY
jgi:hypothetical protein